MSLEVDLKIQKGIRDAEDEIVQAIELALEQKEYEKSGDEQLEESQFRNLLNVATSTNSSEVVKNFLRYQVGKKGGEKKWGRGENSLAEAIVTDIQGMLKNKAEEIAKTALVIENVTAKTKEIHMDLIRRYLGYGSRYLVYKKKIHPATT
jgi:hypothetical protein